MDSSQTTEITVYRHFGSIMPIGMRADGEPKYVLGPQCITHRMQICYFWEPYLFLPSYLLGWVTTLLQKRKEERHRYQLLYSSH
jgi:hypothetical protein